MLSTQNNNYKCEKCVDSTKNIYYNVLRTNKDVLITQGVRLMKNENLNEIKKELLEDVIPNLKKYKEQGKDMVLLKGIAIGLKIAKEEKIA